MAKPQDLQVIAQSQPPKQQLHGGSHSGRSNLEDPRISNEFEQIFGNQQEQLESELFSNQ